MPVLRYQLGSSVIRLQKVKEIMQVTVAKIGKARGLKGEVFLQSFTDIPDDRFFEGEVYETSSSQFPELTIEFAREINGKWAVKFAEVSSREGAEALRNIELYIETVEGEEEDAWYPHELVGLAVYSPQEELIGEVKALFPSDFQDLLQVKTTDGRTGLIPLVYELVTEVDIEAGRVVIDPPAGIFDL